MKNYGKVLLYCYKRLGTMANDYNEMVTDRAVQSFYSREDTFTIALDILRLSENAKFYSALKSSLDCVIKNFSIEETNYLERKYFRSEIRTVKTALPPENRGYYRICDKLAQRFTSEIKKKGITEQWFEENCMTRKFFKRTVARLALEDKI